MALDPILRKSFVSTAYYARVTSASSPYGDPGYGTAVAFSCRSERKPQRVLNGNGEEVTSAAQLTTETEIRLTDRVWQPGADPADPAASDVPKAVNACYDERGSISHWEVFL